MLQFSGALKLRQQLDWKKKQKKEQRKAFEMSCDTEYLKNSFWFFRKRGLRRSDNFVCNCFDDFCTNLPEIIEHFHQKQNTKFPKRRWLRSKNVFLSAAMLFSLVVTRKKMFLELPQISLLGTIRVFCSNAESRFGCASSRRLGLVLWLFTSCVWDVLWYRILIKTALFSLEKQRISETALSTFKNCHFELWWAGCFGCN